MALLSLREFTGFRTKKKILGEKFSISKLSVGNFYKAWNDRIASRTEKIVGEISNFNLDENPLRILREWVEVDSREAKLLELSSRAF